MKRIAAISAVTSLAAVILLILTLEGVHYYRFHHFAGYGPHIDVVLGDSDVGRRDTYVAVLWNVSVKSMYIEGCRLPGGIAGNGILYRWDVQKWNSSAQRWDSLRGADNWVPSPFGGYGNDEKCRAEMTRLRPVSRHVLGWVFNSWVTTGDPARIAIHTSLSRPPSDQLILYTTTFAVDGRQALPPLVKW